MNTVKVRHFFSPLGEALRRESVAGALLLLAALLGICWANSPIAQNYFDLRDFEFGFSPAGLQLSLGQWATEALLAIFFFLIGLELHQKFTVGELNRVSTAIIPIFAAVGGVVVPALIYLGVTGVNSELARGWAIPTATDIAFALAVLAFVGTHLPGNVRTFLLTLAVVDDLIAIVIIAVFYSANLQILPLVLSIIPLALYATLIRRYRKFFFRNAVAAWGILLPLAVLAWVFIQNSGIHPTLVGVILGFLVPARASSGKPALAEVFEHRFRPLSTILAVPIFAFFASGVALGKAQDFTQILQDPVSVAVVLALVLGKPVGILGSTWLLGRVTRMRAALKIHWADLGGVSVLAGIGFTVSLLVTELSFSPIQAQHDHAKTAIFVASIFAAILGSFILALRNRQYRSGVTWQDADRVSE